MKGTRLTKVAIGAHREQRRPLQQQLEGLVEVGIVQPLLGIADHHRIGLSAGKAGKLGFEPLVDQQVGAEPTTQGQEADAKIILFILQILNKNTANCYNNRFIILIISA